jgi:hypothetical protein
METSKFYLLLEGRPFTLGTTGVKTLEVDTGFNSIWSK